VNVLVDGRSFLMLPELVVRVLGVHALRGEHSHERTRVHEMQRRIWHWMHAGSKLVDMSRNEGFENAARMLIVGMRRRDKLRCEARTERSHGSRDILPSITEIELVTRNAREPSRRTRVLKVSRTGRETITPAGTGLLVGNTERRPA
jgi:hypothetical protein